MSAAPTDKVEGCVFVTPGGAGRRVPVGAALGLLGSRLWHRPHCVASDLRSPSRLGDEGVEAHINHHAQRQSQRRARSL